MTWTHDPGLDPAALAEEQARRTDALETVAAAIDGGDFDRARGVLFMRGDGPGRAAIECLKANHGPTGWAGHLGSRSAHPQRRQPGPIRRMDADRAIRPRRMGRRTRAEEGQRQPETGQVRKAQKRQRRESPCLI